MNELSLTTLSIVANTKVVLFAFVFILILILFKKNRPWLYLLLITGALFLFYLFFSYPLQKMLWGNSGDESFIFAFLTKVIHGSYFSDFYYSWLPTFYTPLYFWVTGIVSKLFTDSGIVAAKIGVLGTILVWFFGSYFWQKLYQNKINKKQESDFIIESKWFWLLLPIIYFLSLDFDVIVLKPYETVSALFCILLIGFIFQNFEWQRWNWKKYLFFGLSSGILFLTYYFWWFILIPTLIILVLISKNKLQNFKRILLLGIIIFFISSPYLIPLILSFIKYGMENWQAVFFIPNDFSTFTPWMGLSLKTILFIFGLTGLIFFQKNKFIRSNLIILVVCYIYQFLNIIYFILGNKPIQASKPFMFLGSATLMVGTTYLIIYIYQKILIKYSLLTKKIIALIIVLIFVPFLPFGKFIDDPVVKQQIEKDLVIPKLKYLTEIIDQRVSNYKNIIWLSGGTQELNAYLPLSYYIAYNSHFSHQAAIYSKRMDFVKTLSQQKNAEDFYNLTQNVAEPKIDGLIFYHDKDKESFVLYFWQDNYPNGGKDFSIKIKKNLISDQYWQKIYNDETFSIFLAK